MRTVLLTFLIIGTVSEAGFGADTCSSAELRLILRDKNPHVVKTLEDQWAQAYANRDMKLLNCILADDFEIGSMPDLSFEFHTKQDVLLWVATRSGSAELEKLQIKPSGNAVVARGVCSVRQGRQLVSRFQFTDFFVYRGGRWQAVARVIAPLSVQ